MFELLKRWLTRLSAEELETIARLNAQGDSAYRISKKLGRPVRKVYRAILTLRAA